MGDVKTAMKPSSKDVDLTKEKKPGMFSRLAGRSKKDPVDTQVVAKTFADFIIEAETELDKLIVVKKRDLDIEAGLEVINRKKLGVLETMRFHLEEVAGLADDYTKL